MTPYNVEIFDSNLSMRHHSNVDSVAYSRDYITPKTSRVAIPYSENVEKGDYIRIYRDSTEYFGRIKTVEEANAAGTQLSIEYESFIDMFNAEVLFDINSQTDGTALEDEIAALITQNWICNSDSLQNIFGLRVETISSTTNWDFYITASTEGLHYSIVNMYDQIVVPALTKYQIGVYAVPDFSQRTITIRIGKVSAQPYYVEADMPNVITKNIVLGETSEDVNKLIVYNTEDLQTRIIYYKHNDLSYDTRNADRITPVIYAIATVTPSEQQTLAEGAKLAADRQFDQASYNNLIEITVLNDDTLVKPETLEIGQLTYIISEGKSYTSMLTGKEIGAVTKLIYGTIRLDLTQIIKEIRNA